MSTSSHEPQGDTVISAAERHGPRRPTPEQQRLLVQLLGALGVGIAAGVLWYLVADPPAYLVGDSGNATMGERDLAAVFTVDYWFAVIGALFGLLQGIWAWRWFGYRGWVVVPVVLACSCVAALVAWGVGEGLGPHGFDQRMAQARPGDRVVTDFRLQAHSALAMWPLGAILPVMIASAFLPAPEDRLVRRLRRRTPRPD